MTRVLMQIPAEGEKGERDQFDVLLGERDANYGYGKDERRDQMGQGDLPAEQYQPDQVKDNAKRTVCVLPFDYVLAKRGEGCNTDFQGLKAKWNSDHGDAKE